MNPAIVICDYLTPEKYWDYCRENHFGIELQQFYDPEFNAPTDKLCAKLGKIHPLAIHAPFFDLSPGSFDEKIREVTFQRFRAALEHAQRLACQHVIFHNSFYPQLHFREGWSDRALSFWRYLLKHCPERTTCYIENTVEEGPDLLQEVCTRVNNSQLKVVLDIGHAHAFSTVSRVEWVEQLGPLIGYVHLHSNDGRSDQHLGLASGTAPIEEVCLALRENSPNAIWAIEARGEDAVRESVCWLRERGLIT